MGDTMPIIDPQLYITQSMITNPYEFGGLFEKLPGDIPEIVKVIQGLLLHVFWAERYGVKLDEEQHQHVQNRTVRRILTVIQQLDGRQLNYERPYQSRFFGNCRDHSVLMCAILRSKGIPARARCGFARYFIPDWFEDHWICEYWNSAKQRWVVVDPQLDSLQRDVLQIDFNPLDIPRGHFITGSEAWQLCRSGRENAEKFGIGELHGLWFVRHDLMLDMAALNKMELLPWDFWGITTKEDSALTPADWNLLDRVAELVLEQDPMLLNIYENEPALKVPPVIHSYQVDGAVEVDLMSERG